MNISSFHSFPMNKTDFIYKTCCLIHLSFVFAFTVGGKKESLIATNKKKQSGASLVVQWLRICLPVQGTRVRPLVWEDPTCRGAAKPMHHNYWGCTLEPVSHNYWSPCATTTEARAPTARALQQEKPLWWEAHAPQRRVVPPRRN